LQKLMMKYRAVKAQYQALKGDLEKMTDNLVPLPLMGLLFAILLRTAFVCRHHCPHLLARGATCELRVG
jgi:hypothetical protein